MKIKYNSTTNKISFTLDDPDFGVGNQVIDLTVNCCEHGVVDGLPVIVRRIVIPLTFITGSLLITSYTIGGVVYTCTDNTCENIQGTVDDVIAGFRIETTVTATEMIIEMRNVPVATTVTMQATIGGVTINPVVQVLPAEYVLNPEYTVNGIYSITVTKTLPADGINPPRIISESSCYFLDEDVVCVLTDYLAKEENKNSTVHLLYNAIKESVLCGCNCKDLCLIYRSILLELNLLDRCTIC